MSLLVVGSVAYDSVETPFGKVTRALGGAATFFSIAASHFTDVRLVGVVGQDFKKEHEKLLRDKGIDLKGLKRAKGKTFHWAGKYSFNLNERETLATDLNVFETFKPKLPKGYENSDYVFLANIDPEIQMDVLSQVKAPKLIALDTMNFWIEGKLNALKKLLKKVDVLVINDGEARELSNEWNLVKAARCIHDMGPPMLIIKQGEYGALLFSEGHIFNAPGYPLEEVFDPTGAGDTFAGGFMGHLAGEDNFHTSTLRQAIIMGSVMASFAVESFSVDRLISINRGDIENRYRSFKRLTEFHDLGEPLY